jgi:hypothetical protein
VIFSDPIDMRGMTRKAAAERTRAVIRRALGAQPGSALGVQPRANGGGLG